MNGVSPEPTYETVKYESIEAALKEIEEADYINNCPEGSYYYHPLMTLLKDVTIDKVKNHTLNEDLGQIFVEMNGHKLTITDEGGLTGTGVLMFEGSKRGTLINSGNIALGGLYIFNACNLTVTGGTIDSVMNINEGNVNISGGEFKKKISITNTHRDRNINVNISGAAKIANLEYQVTKDFSSISLNLLGGYYAQDPKSFKTYNNKDQSGYVNYDATKREQYSNQTDWEADTATYTYRIKREVSASSYSKVPAAVTGLVESGSAQALITAGTAVGGTIKYALGTDATTAPASGWSTNIPTATSAGTYYVWYRLDPDADHTAIAAACIIVSIAEKSSEDPNTDPQNDPEDNKEEETPTSTPVPVDNSNDSPFSPVPEITATTESLYLVKGQSFALNETGWTTPDKKTVAVSKKGVVSAKKATGSTPVVLTKKTETAEKTLKIYVAAPSVTKKNTMNAGETFTVTLTSDFKDKLPIFWYSSATDIATVDQSGKVTAVTKGSAVITAQIAGKAYTCKITVKEATVLAERTLHISTGTTTLSLKGVKKPVYSTASSNIVIKGSKVTAENPGTAVVNVKDKEGKDYKINLIIEDPTITSLTAGKTNKYTTELQVGKSKAITFKAYDREAIFKSSKPKVAYVNEKGEIVALSKGKAKLTTKINGKTVTVTVKVTEFSYI
ncbi:MAG: Ig-like domain-containing protein [Lachnospiraceae bacterium]|nr:Ig-like domain-containing protein [Lachnospiraceae bacterium]